MSLLLRLTPVLGLLALGSHSVRSANVQTPTCQMKVVSCNYAYLYTGRFSWTISLNAPASQFKEQVAVSVNNGVANCLGTVHETSNGQTQSGTVSGPGLFAVEFVLDSANNNVYRITAACPSVAGMGSPVQPAELGHHDMTTYEQAASAIAQKVMQGTSNYPAPETDPVNNVTGVVQVTWNITRP